MAVSGHVGGDGLTVETGRKTDFPGTGASEAVTARGNPASQFLSLRWLRCSFDGGKWWDESGLLAAA